MHDDIFNPMNIHKNEYIIIYFIYIYIYLLYNLYINSCTTKELEDAMQFMKKHNIKPPISSVLPLSQAREAQKLLHDKKVTGRVVLKVNEESEW